MMNRKGGGTITGVFLTILLTMALFYGMYGFVDSNYTEVGVVDTLGYNQSNLALQTAQANLSSNIEDLQASGRAIVEAPSNIFLVAWNGLTGLAATMRIFFGIIDISVTVFDALLPALGFLPVWVKSLVNMGIIISKYY